MPNLSDLIDSSQKVKIITVEGLHQVDTPAEREKLLSDGYLVEDRRENDEVNKVFVKAIKTKAFENVSRSGFYRVLTETGTLEDALVLVDFPIPFTGHNKDPLRNSLTFSNPLACVILLKGKEDGAYPAFITQRRFVYADAHYISDAFQDLYDKFDDADKLLSKTRVSIEDVFVIFHKSITNHVSSTPPFHIIDRKQNKNDYHRMLVRFYDEFMATNPNPVLSATHIEYQLPRQTLMEDRKSTKYEVVFGRVTRSILFEPPTNQIFVPVTSRMVKINITSCSCTDDAYPGIFSDPMVIQTIAENASVPLKVVWEKASSADYVILNGKKMDPFSAFKELMLKYELRENDAKKVLATAKTLKEAEFYLAKGK
jgi:hypothetical protein